MNYHLFIVDEISLKYHIEYGFVGTGNSNVNNHCNIGLWKDIARLKGGDKIVFYVQKMKRFYGFFKVCSSPYFDPEHYLQPTPMPFLGENNIRLRYRSFIETDVVFANGIDEFDLVDILPVNSRDVLWSVLYRKLKGARGCSPLFESEYNKIFQEISNKNHDICLDSNCLTFQNGQIAIRDPTILINYTGSSVNIQNTKNDIIGDSYSEHHLHALLIEHIPTIIFGQLKWLGNEVYSGAGMQAIDILSIDHNNIYRIIEVKKSEIPNGITEQVGKYLNWLKNRFNQHNTELFQPIIIGSRISSLNKQRRRFIEFSNFNLKALALPIKYFEYFTNTTQITIVEVDYMNNWNILRNINI